MRQKNGFDRFTRFKSTGIEFEVGDKYLFRQSTGLLMCQSCQACLSKPLARHYNKKISRKTKSKIWRYEEEVLIKSKIWRSEIQPEPAILVESRGLLTRVYIIEPDSWVPLRPVKLGPVVILVEVRVHVVYRCCNLYRIPPDPWDLATYI
jgi:hypothetical protein